MSTAARPMVPPEGVTGWVVPIDMPVFPDGKDAGQPVGWLTSNNTHTESKWAGIGVSTRRKLWRIAAYQSYLRHRLPPGVGRIYITFQWQFVNGSHPDLINLDQTTKPVIDALQPQKVRTRQKRRKNGTTSTEMVVDLGVGLIPNDNHQWVVAGGQLPLLPYLGPGAGIGGRVVVTIIPFPLAPASST